MLHIQFIHLRVCYVKFMLSDELIPASHEKQRCDTEEEETLA